MCKTSCCLNTPSSETGTQQPGSCARRAVEVAKENPPSQYQEWESGCGGSATVLHAAGQVAVDQSKLLMTEDELGRQYLGAWWDEPIIENRPSFLQRLASIFALNTISQPDS